MEQNDRGHSLHAFINEEDSNLTLHVVGQIRAKGDFVGIKLIEVPLSEAKPGTLVLKFDPDNYDPNGITPIQITPFNKKLTSVGQYKNVVIESQQGNIYLELEPSYAGGGSEIPRG